VAYLKANAIITRVREIIEDGQGSLRTISATRFTGGYPEGGVGDDELARRGIAVSKPVQVVVRSLGRHPNSPPIGGNLEILEVEVEVAIARTIAIEEMVDDDAHTTLAALALEDVDVIRQALEWPANLTQTEAADATDLCSLRLDRPASNIKVGGGQGKAYSLEYRLRFTGPAFSRPAIS